MAASNWEPVIGLEVHVQLATESKMFCACKARVNTDLGQSVSSEMINANTCPVCSGHPGTLPAINKRAVEYAIRAGIALKCQVRNRSVFSRKNYFYPDLPKGYQISQYDQPICESGELEIETASGQSKTIGIQRAHLEEDAGKNVHMASFSVVNLNRAGVPLLEIVSRPDIANATEAGAYLRNLYAIVTAIGICDGNLQEGNFRCDANVSVRPKGTEKLGTRTEIKNVNSFRFVEKAIEFEIARQIEVIENGGKIVQETRTYDSAKNKTIAMRSKEEAHDYRYFPEPDLVPLVIEDRFIAEVKSLLPELPQAKKKRFIETHAMSAYDAGLLTSVAGHPQYFETVLSFGPKPVSAEFIKGATNMINSEVLRLTNETGKSVTSSHLAPKELAAVVRMQVAGDVSSTGAKTIVERLWSEGGEAEALIAELGLKQVNDTGALETIVTKLIADFPEQSAEYKAGKEKLLGFFVGQAMKQSQGKANPQLIRDILEKKLRSE